MSAITKNPRAIYKSIVKDWAKDNIETITVAVVVGNSEYESDRTLDVLPLVMEKEEDGDILVPDTIYRSPVVLGGTAEGVFSFPIQIGDKVLIGFPKRSLDEFIFGSGSSQYTPEDTRIFGSTDAIVLGYLGQSGIDIPLSISDSFWSYKDMSLVLDENNNITISSKKDYKIVINESGKIEVDNSASSIVQEPDGTIIISNNNAEVEVNSSGQISVSNSIGNATLEVSGNCNINGATIDTSGNVITAAGTDLDALKAVFNIHLHDKANSTGSATPPIQQA